MLKILWIIITLILLIWFWTWFIHQVFSHLKITNKWKLFLWWIILVWILFLYEWLFTWLWIDKAAFYIRDAFNITSAWGFILYWLLALLVITLVFRNLRDKKILTQILAVLISIVVLALWWWVFWLWSLLCYYLLAAFTEEALKFTVGNNHSEKAEGKTISTLLLFSLTMWLSFSIAENLLAFIVLLLNWWEITTWMLIARWLVAALVHCVATWAIALVLMKMKKWWLLLKYIVALLLWFLIHFIYNFSSINWYAWVILLITVFSFIGLSYLLVNLDELYEKQ